MRYISTDRGYLKNILTFSTKAYISKIKASIFSVKVFIFQFYIDLVTESDIILSSIFYDSLTNCASFSILFTDFSVRRHIDSYISIYYIAALYILQNFIIVVSFKLTRVQRIIFSRSLADSSIKNIRIYIYSASCLFFLSTIEIADIYL